MFRKMVFGAVSVLAMATSMAHAADMKEFRVGILGGEKTKPTGCVTTSAWPTT